MAKVQPIGTETVNVNGYRNRKVKLADGTTTWRLVHHIIAEEMLGRPLKPSERVEFINKKDRLDVRPENLQVVKRGQSSAKNRAAAIHARITELMAQYKDLTGEDYSNG